LRGRDITGRDIFVGVAEISIHRTRQQLEANTPSAEEQANAELIVRAVNSYDAMREALELAKETLRVFNGMGMSGEIAKRCWEAYQHSPEMKQINAALSLTEGDKP
jgi:hypothetical protein